MKTGATQETPSVVVTTALDVVDKYDSLISLREAIAYANDEVGNEITFDESLAGSTIALTNGQFTIEKTVSIDGSGMNISLDAQGKSQLFEIQSGASLTVSGLTLGHASRAVYNNGSFTTVNTVFSNNGTSDIWGSAVYNNGTFTAVNSLFTDNRSRNSAIFNGCSTSLVNCTVAGNIADIGNGGIGNYIGGVLNVYNSIVVDNGADFYSEDGDINGYNSLSSFVDWSNRDASDVVNYKYAASVPLFVDQANGDYRLALNSQALDRGSNAFASNFGLTEDSTDLDGAPRFMNDTIDLGPYELAPYPYVDIKVVQNQNFTKDENAVVANLLVNDVLMELLHPTMSVDSDAFAINDDYQLVYWDGLNPGVYTATVSGYHALFNIPSVTCQFTVETTTLDTLEDLTATDVSSSAFTASFGSVLYAETYVVAFRPIPISQRTTFPA